MLCASCSLCVCSRLHACVYMFFGLGALLQLGLSQTLHIWCVRICPRNNSVVEIIAAAVIVIARRIPSGRRVKQARVASLLHDKGY